LGDQRSDAGMVSPAAHQGRALRAAAIQNSTIWTGKNMAWKWPWPRNAGNGAVLPERKGGGPGGFVAIHAQGEARWTRRDYATLAREGFMRNPVVHRAVRLISETASAIPWLLYEGAAELDDHPLLQLLERPNQRQAGSSFLEALYGHLL